MRALLAAEDSWTDTDRLDSANASRSIAMMAQLPKPRMVYAAANFFDRAGHVSAGRSSRGRLRAGRGSVESPGKPVDAGALSCVETAARSSSSPTQEGARRAALARWITEPKQSC